jgi:hypothetical protein
MELIGHDLASGIAAGSQSSNPVPQTLGSSVQRDGNEPNHAPIRRLSNSRIIGFGWITNDSNPIQCPAQLNAEGQQRQI